MLSLLPSLSCEPMLTTVLGTTLTFAFLMASANLSAISCMTRYSGSAVGFDLSINRLRFGQPDIGFFRSFGFPFDTNLGGIRLSQGYDLIGFLFSFGCHSGTAVAFDFDLDLGFGQQTLLFSNGLGFSQGSFHFRQLVAACRR